MLLIGRGLILEGKGRIVEVRIRKDSGSHLIKICVFGFEGILFKTFSYNINVKFSFLLYNVK